MIYFLYKINKIDIFLFINMFLKIIKYVKINLKFLYDNKKFKIKYYKYAILMILKLFLKIN